MHSCLESHSKHLSFLCDPEERISQSPPPESGQAGAQLPPGGPPHCKSPSWGIAQADHTQHMGRTLLEVPQAGPQSQQPVSTACPSCLPGCLHLASDC